MTDRDEKRKVIVTCENCDRFTPARLEPDGTAVPIGTSRRCSCGESEYRVVSFGDDD